MEDSIVKLADVEVVVGNWRWLVDVWNWTVVRVGRLNDAVGGGCILARLDIEQV